MIISQLLFYMFATVIIAASVAMIFSRHLVHAVLFLILAFVNAAGLFLLQGAEFLAMILIVVYVGAIAVFFLFVVMMLEVNFSRSRQGWWVFLPFGSVVGFLLAAEIITLAINWPQHTKSLAETTSAASDHLSSANNTLAVAISLYTDYGAAIVVSGLILLSAMIGAIVLTLRHRPDVKRQNIKTQNLRRSQVRLVNPTSGEGLS